jgi:hypothetical protein
MEIFSWKFSVFRKWLGALEFGSHLRAGRHDPRAGLGRPLVDFVERLLDLGECRGLAFDVGFQVVDLGSKLVELLPEPSIAVAIRVAENHHNQGDENESPAAE